MPQKTKSKKQTEYVGLLGVGFDHDDGHQRLTRGDHFLLVGGSEETHERMTDVAVHFNENLRKRGKRFAEISVEELIEIIESGK